MNIFRARFYKDIFKLLGDAASEFSKDNAMKMSASLAYYTIFSIAPLLLIVIWLVGFFYGELLAGPQDAQAEVFDEFANIFGPETAARSEEHTSELQSR